MHHYQVDKSNPYEKRLAHASCPVLEPMLPVSYQYVKPSNFVPTPSTKLVKTVYQ